MFAGLARAVLLFGVAATSVFSEKARAAGAAYAVDTAEVSEPGACKVESWISIASNHDVFTAATPTCVVNVFRPMELSAQLIHTRADEEWTSGIAPKIKTNLVPTAIGSWGIAISGTATYDLTNQQTVAMFATVPATLRLSNVLRINLNAGWEWDRIAGQTLCDLWCWRGLAHAGQCLDADRRSLRPVRQAAGRHWRDRAALPGRAALASDR